VEILSGDFPDKILPDLDGAEVRPQIMGGGFDEAVFLIEALSARL